MQVKGLAAAAKTIPAPALRPPAGGVAAERAEPAPCDNGNPSTRAGAGASAEIRRGRARASRPRGPRRVGRPRRKRRGIPA